MEFGCARPRVFRRSYCRRTGCSSPSSRRHGQHVWTHTVCAQTRCFVGRGQGADSAAARLGEAWQPGQPPPPRRLFSMGCFLRTHESTLKAEGYWWSSSQHRVLPVQIKDVCSRTRQAGAKNCAVSAEDISPLTFLRTGKSGFQLQQTAARKTDEIAQDVW